MTNTIKLAESLETQMAVAQNDLSHIKRAIDTISLDIKEMKGAYVTSQAFEAAKIEAVKEHENFITKDEYTPIKDKVKTLWAGAITLVSIVVIAVLGALVSLVVKSSN